LGIGILGNGFSEYDEGSESEYADMNAGINTSWEFNPYSPWVFKLFNLSSEYFTNTIVDYLFNTTTNNITIFDDKENMYISKYLLDVNKFSSFDKVSYFNNEIVSESKLNEYIKLEASSQISIINYDFVNYLDNHLLTLIIISKNPITYKNWVKNHCSTIVMFEDFLLQCQQHL